MQRRYQIMILTLVISSVIIVAYASHSVIESSNLMWEVEIGEEFIYEISTFRDSPLEEFPLPLDALNHTRIRFVISHLPTISAIWTGGQFIEDIVEVTKTTCSFENGTELPINQSLPLNAVLSTCILPVGNWDYIDLLLPDNSMIESYLAYSLDSAFYFGFDKSFYDEGSGWWSLVNKTTGMPTLYSHIYTYVYFYPTYGVTISCLNITLLNC